MNTSIAIIPEQFIFAQGDDLKTTSIKVAEAFNKLHKNILQKIQNIECSKEFNELNFKPVEYVDEKGEKRPMYEMTKDGFMFLVMGFTGKPAAAIKEAYINAFNVMYNKLFPRTQYGLKSLPPSLYISEAEAAQLKKSLATHCQKTGVNNYAELYGKIYAYFGITSYLHIPAGKLPEAARLIGVKLVTVKKPVLPAEPMKLSFTAEELEDLVTERVKSIQGELVNESSKAYDLNLLLPDDCRVIGTRKGGVTVKIELIPDDVQLHTIDQFMGMVKTGYILIDKKRLDEITIKQLGTLLA